MGEKKDYLRKEQFRRYQAKPFRNPYFQGQKQRTSLWKRYLMIISVSTLTVGLTYLIGFAPFWNIRDIRIEGLQYISGAEITEAVNQELAAHRYLIFPERNRLFFNRSHLAKVLDQQFSFEQLSVEVRQGTVIISVKERVSQVLWLTGNIAYYLDVGGTIIRALPSEDAELLVWHGSTQPTLSGQVMEGPYPRIAYLSSLPLISLEDDSAAEPGQKVLSDQRIAGIIAMANFLKDRELSAELFSVEHLDSIWARAELEQGFDVLFDISGDISAQGGYLMTVLEKEVPDRSSLDYVDLRFGDHVYFKIK